MAIKEFDTVLTKKNNIGYKLYFYLVPILYAPLFLFFYRSSILLNQFLYFSCLFVLIFNYIILKKLEKLYPGFFEYKYTKMINWVYVVGYSIIAIIAFVYSMLYHLPGGV